METPTNEQLKKAIASIVKANDGEPIGLKAVIKSLESKFDLEKGTLESKKKEIKEMLEAAINNDDSESDDEIIPTRKETKAAPEPAGRTRGATVSTEPVAVEDEEIADKTAGKSRAGQQPDHQGFLKKRGDQGRIKLWRKRHFRLYRKEGVIAYFKSDKDNEQLGEVSVTGAFLIEKRDDLGKFVFTITMKTTARVWILQAPDEAVMNQWISVCTPLMKETAAVRAVDPNKKPPKPLPGLPLPFPPTYVQGFSEREPSATLLQDGDNDWTKLSHKAVTPVQLAPGQVAIAVRGTSGVVEEVREVQVNGAGEAFVPNVPKQLKYSMETVGWTSGTSQLVQTKFEVDEKTQRDLLKKLVGRTVVCTVPGTGAGHEEDFQRRQDTRAQGSTVGGGNGGLSLAFPSEAKFQGTLVYDTNDDRYALVEQGSNTVHFLNTRDARTIKAVDADVTKLNAGTTETFTAPRLWVKLQASQEKSIGHLTYTLKDGFDTHVNYVVTLGADEKTADVQGWASVHNKTSKTFNNAVLTVVDDGSNKGGESEGKKEDKEKAVEEVAEEEGKKKAASKGFGGLMNIAGALLGKKEEEEEKAPPKVHRYPQVQKVTLPSYDWAHVAFVSQNVAVKTQHLVTFATPKYMIKPIVEKDVGVDAAAEVNTVIRFANPLKESLPSGRARVSRRDKSGLGVVEVAEKVGLGRVEGGETVVLSLEKLHGVRVTRKQTGYNFDAEKHFVIETLEITVANGRNETVDLTVEESLYRWSTFEIPSSKPAHSSTSHPRKISWDVRLNHGEDITIKYTAFYSTFSLDSDYEPVA